MSALLCTSHLSLPAAALAQERPEADDKSADIIVIGHQLNDAPMASKADIPPLENSQAISIVSQQTLRDRGILRLGDALSAVAGVSRNNNYGFFDGFNIRGFNASSGATYLDGLLDDTGYGTSEMTGLERVEVVKGPASGLFGQGPLSGIVNMVSKRPRDEASLDAGVSAGSYDLVELRADANGPLTRDGAVTGRLTGVYRDQDFFVHASGQKRIFLAPSLTWRVTPRTALTLLGRYQKDDIRPWSPTTAYGTALPNPHGPLPINLSINDAVFPAVQKNDYWNLGYVFDHQVNDAVAIHQSLRYQDFHNSWDNWLFITGINAQAIPATATTPVIAAYSRVSRAFYGPYDENGTYFRVDTNASARFDTGPLNHYVLAGVDYGRRKADNVNLYDTSKPYYLDLYATAAFGPVVGGVAGTLQLFANAIGSAAALARFFLDTLASIWPAIGVGGMSIALLVAIYTTLALVNIAGTRDGTRLTVLLGIVKLVPLLAIIGFGFFAIRPGNLTWHAMPSVDRIGEGAMILILAFMVLEP